MYSFLFYGSESHRYSAGAIEKACAITRRLMPSLGCTIRVSQRTLPQAGAGWFYLYPEELADKPLITEFVAEDVAVLAFGDMVRPTPKTAEIIANAWRTGGIDKVRRLDGCFGAVIVNLHEKTVYIASDLMGLRALTCFCDGDVLLASPHDVPIVATGLCPVEYDLASAASILACDWSLGGKALLKHLTVTDPNQYVVWKHGIVQNVRRPLILASNRLDSADKGAIRRNIDQMIEKMRADVRFITKDAQIVDSELTAGMDTRAVMAILLSVLEPSRIRAITGGAPTHFDVKVAHRIAAAYGFDHRHFQKGARACESFLPFSRLLAFVTNGTTTSEGATYRLPQPATKGAIPTFRGGGGEIYRGFYGPSPLHRPPLSRYTADQLLTYMDRKFPRIHGLPWADGATPDALVSRLHASFEAMAAISREPSDMLNLFYLYERYCRWGSGSARRTYIRDRFSLFQSPALVQLAYRLPAPVTQNALLHRTAIRRYMPKAYSWLVNQRKCLPLLDYPRLSKALTEVMMRITETTQRVQRRLSARTANYHEALGDVFAEHLGDVLTDMLLATDSIALDIFGRETAENMLNQHISRTASHIQTIGYLATLQQYKRLITEASTLSRQEISGV